MAPVRRYVVKVKAPPNTNQFLYFEIDVTNAKWKYIKPFHPQRNNWLSGGEGDCWWDVADRLYLKDRYNRNRIMINFSSLAGQIGQSGPAYHGYNLPGNANWESTWEACARPLEHGMTGVWFGIAGKGGGEVGLGADAAYAAVWNLDNLSKGMSFIVYSGRVGLAIGWSGALAACLVTGIQSPNQLQGFAFSDKDYALSIGGPLKKTATAVREAAEFVEAARAAKFAAAAEKLFSHTDAVFNLGKKILKDSNIDPDETTVSLLDLPGPGVEIGVYWYWAQVRGVISWSGHPQIPSAGG